MSPSQQQTALSLLKKLDNRDYDGIASILSDKFTQQFLPASLGGMFTPIRDKNQYLEFLKGLEQLVTSFNVSSTKILQGMLFWNPRYNPFFVIHSSKHLFR